MSIWEAFGKGRYKGFSREAGLLLDEAVELAGGLGCKKADTGHLLLAMLQTDHGPAAKFLAGKNISELAVRRQLGADREGPALHLDRKALAPDLKRAMDYALIGAQNAHLAKAEPEHLLCAMLEDTDCAAGVLLASMGVQLAEAVRECRQLSGQFILPLQPRAASAMPRGSRASDKYCRDLTRRAADGEFFEGAYIFGAFSNSLSIGGMLKYDENSVDMNDGKLEMLLIRKPETLPDLHRLILALKNNDFSDKHIDFASASTFRLHAAAGFDWSIDGEYAAGGIDTVIRCVKDAVCIAAPRVENG